MGKTLNRRAFLKTSAIAGASPFFTGSIASSLLAAFPSAPCAMSPPDVVAVTGDNAYDATRRAVELLGGMQRFTTPRAQVGLLVNSGFRNPGTYVKPQIALAVIAMCHEVGAKEIVSIEDAPGRYWRMATASGELKEYLEAIKDPQGYTMRKVQEGFRLQEAEFRRDALECDTFINIGIAKDHEGTLFTGQLKNMMGAISGRSNRFFHAGLDGNGDNYEDVKFLSQCIADANRVRKPTLSVNDVTEVIVTNGPFGPGRLARPRTIIAGTDPVVVDVLSAQLIGLDPNRIDMISYAHEYGVGTKDLSRIQIERVAI